MRKIIARARLKRHVGVGLGMGILLSGCGQSGPLYLPTTNPAQSPYVASPAQTPDESYSQPDNEARTERQNQSQPNPQPPTKPMTAI